MTDLDNLKETVEAINSCAEKLAKEMGLCLRCGKKTDDNKAFCFQCDHDVFMECFYKEGDGGLD